MKKVRVWLPFEHGVPYTVEVENPKDLEAIKEAMLKKDPLIGITIQTSTKVLALSSRISLKKLEKK